MHLTTEEITQKVTCAIVDGQKKIAKSSIGSLGKHIIIVMDPGAGKHLINASKVFRDLGYSKIPLDTTRKPTRHELSGNTYNFRTKTTFQSLNIIGETVYEIANAEYGLNLHEFLPLIQDGKRCLFNVSVEGLVALKSLLGEEAATFEVEMTEEMWLGNLSKKYNPTNYDHPYQFIAPRKKFGKKQRALLLSQSVQQCINFKIDASGKNFEQIATIIAEKATVYADLKKAC